tara:strand:- start:666 stop:878 length:213 start_codon:yes stop_codon:yes gene_type:complete
MSSPNSVTVTQVSDVTTVEITTAGPQGPAGFTFDETSKTDGSVIYYDQSSATFKADATTTKLTLVNGGNF